MVKSLVELCTAVCLRNVKDIADIGNIPYNLARPILVKIDNAAQLRQIEINSPQLEADTVEVWKRLIARDFPVVSRREAFVPKNPKSWHKIYAKYQHIDTKAKQDAKEHLKNAYKGLQEEKDRTVSKVINYDSRTLPRLPRDVRPQVGIRAKSRRAGPDQSELRFTGGSRTKTNNPKSLLKRARREAKEITTRNRLNTSVGAGQVRPGQIVRAPVGMVQEKVNNARPLTGIRPPTHQLRSDTGQREIEDREARLQKAKEMNSQKGGSYISDEDLDDLDIEDEDDYIGLEVDDLENLADQPEPSYEARPSRSSPTAARGSVFARKMGSSSTAPSASRIRTEAQTKLNPVQVQKEPTTRSLQSLGPTSPPSKPAPSSSSASPGPGPMLPRKRKAVDIFMRPKSKASRP
ncbi:RNA polymerase II transcription factor SIII subunit A-domain-containing protein [Ustulina deusta]|nr:RNA polymerase II transcription factor SIII subunit A-domain-containing protein [Ustulina deusta]